MFSKLYTKLVANLLFPLHEKLKKHDTVSIKNKLEQSQWLDIQSLREKQNNRFKDFIHTVYSHVPYYKKVMSDNGLSPSDFSTVKDLSKLPMLDKATITENFESLKSDVAGALSRFNTGGSSGQPLIFLLGKERVSHDVAEKWRATRWWDVDIGDSEIVAWGSPIELGTQDKVKLIRDKFMRTELIPAFDLTEEKQLSFLHKIKQQKPKMLFGYPSVFDLLAKTAKANNIQMNNLGIKVAFVTSERLYPYQRENIEAVFGCPVANGYGGRDAGFIAHQCPSGGMHISFEDIVVEIVDSNNQPLPDGKKGEIVVTHLGTSEFPFIRYKTGDIAAISTKQCSCGRGLPLLESLEGRTTDFVVAADGTIMHGLALIYILREIDEVGEFKIVQESIEFTRVKIVPKSEIDKNLTGKIVEGFKQRLGAEVEINIEIVDRIEPEKSGKFRYIISKVTV